MSAQPVIDEPVVVSSSAASALMDFFMDGIEPGFFERHSLKRADLWDDVGISALGQRVCRGLDQAEMVYEATTYTRSKTTALFIWVSVQGVTCLRTEGSKVKLWHCDFIEVPVILADFIGISPRDTYECGPYRFPADFGDALRAKNHRALAHMMLKTGRDYQAQPVEGEPELTPFNYGLQRGLWQLSTVSASPVRTKDGRRVIDLSDQERQVYLSVPECFFIITPSDDDHLSDFSINVVRSSVVWGAVNMLVYGLPASSHV